MSALLDSLSVVWDNPWLRGATVGFVVMTTAMLVAAAAIWFERKWTGVLHNRPGPTERGYAGILQIFADFFKLLQKEDITPAGADRSLFNIAPPLTVLIILFTLAVVPFVPQGPAARLNIGLLLVLSTSAVMVIPTWMAGWASNNKWALLGAMRAVSQSISYEIPLMLAALVPIILAGSFDMVEIVEAQADGRWFLLWPPGPGLAAFVLFYLSSLAESNRIPFDIPEAESELVAGISTEYPGMKFGFFYLAEYLHIFVSAAVASVIFLGGWYGPGPDGVHWMLFKSLFLVAAVITVRWTLLRYRSDQLLRLCWHYFVPAGLVLVMVTGVWQFFTGSA